jgi:hypothetical protein
MEKQTLSEKDYKTVISLKLHNILAENGIESVKTEINRNDPTKIVWKYVPSAKFFELLNEYVKQSHLKKENKIEE